MNKVQLGSMIRFHLSEMKARNAHHEFENLARHLARARVYSNILPATGPVGAGGDAGRDFETYRSSVAHPANAIPDERSSKLRAVTFACTLQAKVASKIKSDVATIAATGLEEEVVYFCEASVPIAKRNDLIKWAESQHGLRLQIFDGAAISEMLVEPEVFWIAQEFLHLPADVFPAPVSDTNEYQELYERWREKKPFPLSASDFWEVKSGLRRATFEADARPHLIHWLDLMATFRAAPATREIARAASYEIAVGNLRGKNDLTSAKEIVDDYFSDVEEWLAPSELQDAATLVSYAFGGWALGHFHCNPLEICGWRRRVGDTIQREIDSSAGPGRLAALLRIRAHLMVVPESADSPPDLEAGFDDWVQMLDAAEQAPLFPVEDFMDHLNKLAPIFAGHPRFTQLVERTEEFVARRAGPALAAEKSFERAIANYKRDDLLIAIRDLHRIQVRWFTGDRLEGFQRATLLLSQCYLELGLAYAAKYMALIGGYLAHHGEEPEVRARLPHMLMQVADADDGAGNSLSYIQMLLLAIGAHCAFEPEPFDQERYPELHKQLGQVAALRGITKRLGIAHENLVDEALANWPAELSETVIAGSQRQDGFWFEGSDDAVWKGIEEAFIGRPFGDLGAERLVEWRALGIRWVAAFQNRYDETAIAEEFIAQLQIAQAAFADTDLLLIPTTVRMELSATGSAGEYSASLGRGGPNAGGITLSIALPASDHTAMNRDEAVRSFVYAAAEIIRHCSALPDKALAERIGPLLRDALSRVFLGRSYREVYCETILRDLFQEDARSRLEPLAAGRAFVSREHSLLGAPNEVGFGYVKEHSLRSIHERYASASKCIRHTLRGLLALPDRRALLLRWRDEGILDWEILSIVANAAANLRFPLEDDEPTPEHFDRIKAMFDRAEDPEDMLDPSLFTDEILAANRHSFYGALMAGWGLQGSPAANDRVAIERFLVDRYGLRSDDVEHEDQFRWETI